MKPVHSLPQPPVPDAAWAYFIDLDGTLIDIAGTPAGIKIDANLRALLARLYRACDGALALVSGRSLDDLDRHLQPLQLPAAGQHGLEQRDARGARTRHATDPELLAPVRAALMPAVARHPALLLEDKGQSLALHYRRAPRLGAYAHRLMRQAASGTPEMIDLQRGKCVIEARPTGWHKGTAISRFLARPPFHARRPVFIGDDLTDEAGFAIINRLNGISIKVGKGRTAARFRLPDAHAVLAWLGGVTENPT